MLYRDGRFVSASIAESSLLALTFLSAIAQVGLDTALAGLIGTGSVRGHAPWSFFLATALASSWAIALVFLGSSFFRLVRFLDAHHHTLKDSRSALVLPLGAESLAAALGSAFLSAAVVWVAQGVHDASPGWLRRCSAVVVSRYPLISGPPTTLHQHSLMSRSGRRAFFGKQSRQLRRASCILGLALMSRELYMASCKTPTAPVKHDIAF